MTTTTPISDLTTTKRASTMDEEKLDSALAMKKHKTDDKKEEDDDCDLSGDSSSDECVKPKPEPEWDVDSFDGREYESDPGDRNYFSDVEGYEKHRAQKHLFFDSKGFVPEPFSGNYPILDEDMDKKSFRKVTVRQSVEELADLCIKKYNEDKNKTVEFVKIVRVYVTGGYKRKHYITFLARERPNGPEVEYQAKAIRSIQIDEPPFPILCRPSPISTI